MSKPICDIPGCNEPRLARGWCSDHYYCWSKYGDPHADRARARPGVAWAHYRATVWIVTADCKVWPFAGPEGDYGVVWAGGRNHKVHHLACTAWNGPPPQGHQAAHGPCHNRKCYNGAHLSWETPKRQAEDRRRDGTHLEGERNPSARLAERDVSAIRQRLATGETGRSLASDYGVSTSLISAIRTGRLWTHVQ